MICDCSDFGKILEGSTGHTSACNRLQRKAATEAAKPPKQKKPIKPVGKAMSQKIAIYTKKKKEFMVGKICPVYPHLKVEDIHHMKSREGDLLLDERYWLAVSRNGHIWIETHPKKAKELGFSLIRTANEPK